MTFTVIQLTSVSLDIIDQQLHQMTEATPNFFNATPVLIDLTLVEKLQHSLDIAGVVEVLRKHSMMPIGLKTSNEAYSSTAKAIGIANLNYSILSQANAETGDKTKTGSKSTNVDTTKNAEQESSTIEHKQNSNNPTQATKTMVIDQTVRSGKQIYAKGCDLIINASVSHGAEVLADGNIHIYGTLNGRALAGVQGNTEARIYCKSLNAELIAIAGNYLVNEQIPDQYKSINHMLAINLEDQNLDFKKL